MLSKVIWLLYIITWCCSVKLIHGASESTLVINGDATIAGLFKMQTAEAGNCGDVDIPSVLSMEAIRWYINIINNDTGNLPFKVGFRYYKTCQNKDVAREQAVDILERNGQCNIYDTENDFIVGVIGPELSSEATAVSSVLSSQPAEQRFLQLSYSSTSTELNLRLNYPNYYRVIPDDDIQITAMVKTMQKLEWNRVSILYENDSYGRTGAEDLQRLALKHNICVPRMDAINTDSARRIDVNEVKKILEEIIIQSPHITGVVYVGGMTVANTILRIVEKQDYKDVPIFLLSESIQLQNKVFYSSDGTMLRKPRGAMSVSAPMIDTSTSSNFWNYIRSSLTDLNAILELSEKDLLLKEVVQTYNGKCSSTSCSPLTVDEANRLISDRSPYVNYALLAAMTMIEALRKTYSTVCSNTACADIATFKNTFKPYNTLQAMDGLSISFDNIEASFVGNTPNIQITNNARKYDVYNYKLDNTDEVYKLVNVGNLTNDDVELDIDKIRDYSDDVEAKHPDLRRGTCPQSEVCEECIRNDLEDVDFHIPGDFYVIGIISVNNRAIPGPLGCGSVRTRHGYQMYLALQYGLEEFKTRIEYKQYNDWFGDNTIGLIVINSCNNELEVVRRILQLHKYGYKSPEGTYIDLTNRILGYIGGQSTDVSEPAALQLNKLRSVQISYSSTNPILSNKDMYPYFMRIITPDDVQSQAIIAIIEELGGKYVQIMYSEGAYGEGGRDAVVKVAKEKYICIAQKTKVLESDRYYEYYEIMRKKPHAKIVILFLRSHVIQPFLRDINNHMEPGEFQFVGSEAWGTNTDVLQHGVSKGAIIVSVEMDKNRDLEAYIKEQVPSFPEPNPWLLEYIQNRQDCYFKWSFDKRFSRRCQDNLPSDNLEFESDPWCIFVFNTLLSFLKGSATFHKERCGTLTKSKLCSDYVNHPTELVKVMKNVKMNIYGDGDIYIYDNKGDGLMGYKIYNIQDNPDDKSKLVYTQVGSYSNSTGLLFRLVDVKYPTFSPIVSSCPSAIACADCQKKSEEPDIKEKERSQDAVVPVLGAIIGLLFVAVIIMIILLVHRCRQKAKPQDTYITPHHLEERQAADGIQNNGQFIDAIMEDDVM